MLHAKLCTKDSIRVKTLALFCRNNLVWYEFIYLVFFLCAYIIIICVNFGSDRIKRRICTFYAHCPYSKQWNKHKKTFTENIQTIKL